MRCDHDQISFVDPAVMPFPGLIQLHDCGRTSMRITKQTTVDRPVATALQRLRTSRRGIADMRELTRHVRYAPIPNVKLPPGLLHVAPDIAIGGHVTARWTGLGCIRSPSQAPAFCQASSARGRSVSGPASAGRLISRMARQKPE